MELGACQAAGACRRISRAGTVTWLPSADPPSCHSLDRWTAAQQPGCHDLAQGVVTEAGRLSEPSSTPRDRLRAVAGGTSPVKDMALHGCSLWTCDATLDGPVTPLWKPFSYSLDSWMSRSSKTAAGGDQGGSNPARTHGGTTHSAHGLLVCWYLGLTGDRGSH